jgi:16S rRNA (cytosine967-C5)-methyltransferase
MSVRRAAIDVVLAAERSKRFVDQVLAERLRDPALDDRDRGLLVEIVYGSVRHRATLDCILAAFTKRPLDKAPRPAVEAMRQALHQCFFLDRIPQAAAVHEAVGLVRASVGEPVAKFANAVLRAATRAAGIAAEAPAGADVRATLVVRTGKTITFDRPIFADPSAPGGVALHLAQTLSYPPWLIERWIARHGLDGARSLALAQNLPPAIVVRPQPMRTTATSLCALFEQAGVACRVLADDGLLELSSSGSVEALPGFGDGLFSVQDRNAAKVVPLLDPQPGERVLDLCAAPGGKSTQIAERMRDRGRVVAADVSETRLRLVVENAQRLGLACIETLALDGREAGARFPAAFDRVLVDAPCSNTGVLARRPEARWRVGDAPLRALVELQRELLASAALAVRPGGVLVHSTCSLEPEENGEQISAFLASAPQWTCTGRLELLPHRDGGDGAFAAKLERRA